MDKLGDGTEAYFRIRRLAIRAGPKNSWPNEARAFAN